MEIEWVQLVEQPTASIRRRVAMSNLIEVYDNGFTAVAAALEAQGVAPAGPPFGLYHGRPNEEVDLEVGFPVATAVMAAGDVRPSTLPGGRAVQAVHVGSYDSMVRTYERLEAAIREAGDSPGEVMWEQYLTDPTSESDPASWRTLVVWPLA